MRRVGVAFAIGAVVFTAVWASAASLDVGSGVLQSGGGATGTCDADGVTTAYTLIWNPTAGDYDVDKVTVKGIHASCATLAIDVDLVNTSGASLSHFTTTVQASGGNQEINVPDTAAANVAKAQVAIHS